MSGSERGIRIARRLEIGLLLLMWVGAFAGYAVLPDRFPIHFDLAGQPDGWVERGAGGFLIWMLLPASATLVSWLMRWAPRAARSNPTLWNVPHKREFLALDPSQREPIHRRLAESMAWLALMTTCVLVFVQVFAFLSAVEIHVWTGAALVLPFGMTIVAVVFAVRASRRAKHAIEEATRSKESRNP